MSDQIKNASRRETEARGETFYQGPSRVHLASFPPKERWDDWVELDSKAWPKRVEKRYMIVPTTCFNCESACGLLAYVDKETMEVRKLEGNPEHPGSRGRNCAKGPATLNQVQDTERILYPMKRKGPRGGGEWERVSWDEALDDIAGRIRKALQEGRRDEVMYHVGRPGEDHFTERILQYWGIDGHNSHTNICSSNARAGYQFWGGFDRPSPDYANADVIVLVSSHLETGHYFNPHAQRIMEAKHKGAKLIVLDTRLSNTATHADAWLSPYPGSEPAIFLAIGRYLVEKGLYNRDYVRRWWNWQEYMAAVHGSDDEKGDATFEDFEKAFVNEYADLTFEYAAAESGIDADQLRKVADMIATSGTRLATHNWRSSGAGNEGGWQVARTLFMLNALMGAVGTEGGTMPNSWNKFSPKPIHPPEQNDVWNELNWPREYPLSHYEMSILLPHFLKTGRGKLDVYFTRVYNPIWTNPDGFSWLEALSDESLVGLHIALTPTWNETAYFADYILPMGHASERHDLVSYETHNSRWIGFRQPVLRAAKQKLGEDIGDTREINPGEVWEENEFWLELTWRMDPDGAMGIRKFVESKKEPGTRLGLDELYGHMFENSVPGLPEKAAKEDLTPLEYMRRYGVYEVESKVSVLYEEEDGDGVEIEGEKKRGFKTPSKKLEFYSPTLAAWGWEDAALPAYIKSHVHPENLQDGQIPLISTFRLPVQIHTRSANSKWLDEIAHTNPLWIHPTDAERMLGLKTGELVRVETEIGYFVVKAWVTEGIRPGIVACSHHMGRWKLKDKTGGQRQLMATVRLDQDDTAWKLNRLTGSAPYESTDPDTQRIWWTDVGVHQNLTFPVHPDPLSGMHCWHQAVRVRRAAPNDKYGDVFVDTARSREVYEKWMAKTRPADKVSPDGNRRPLWMLRPMKPTVEAYKLPERDRED